MSPRPHRARLAALALTLTAVSCLIGAAGCEVIGYPIQVIAGPPTIKALYPIQDRPTVVLVDDPNHLLPQRQLGTLLAASVGSDLQEAEAVEQVISPTEVDALRHEHADFATWPVDRIGRRLGAAQVIYVLVQGFSLASEADAMKPVLAVRVKVVDVATKSRLWPIDDRHGLALQHTRFFEDMSDAPATNRQLVARHLAEETGRIIGRLFHDYRRPEPGSGLPG